MSHLVAHFPDQASAMGAMSRLVGRGLSSGGVVPITDSSIGGARTSADVPSNPPSQVSHHGDREPRNTSDTLKSPRGMNARSIEPQTPSELGASRLAVALDRGLDEGDIRHLLHEAGATSIDMDDGELPQEVEGFWPATGPGESPEVQAAITASRRGAEHADEPIVPGEDRPSMKTAHDPHR